MKLIGFAAIPLTESHMVLMPVFILSNAVLMLSVTVVKIGPIVSRNQLVTVSMVVLMPSQTVFRPFHSVSAPDSIPFHTAEMVGCT